MLFTHDDVSPTGRLFETKGGLQVPHPENEYATDALALETHTCSQIERAHTVYFSEGHFAGVAVVGSTACYACVISE